MFMWLLTVSHDGPKPNKTAVAGGNPFGSGSQIWKSPHAGVVPLVGDTQYLYDTLSSWYNCLGRIVICTWGGGCLVGSTLITAGPQRSDYRQPSVCCVDPCFVCWVSFRASRRESLHRPARPPHVTGILVRSRWSSRPIVHWAQSRLLPIYRLMLPLRPGRWAGISGSAEANPAAFPAAASVCRVGHWSSTGSCRAISICPVPVWHWRSDVRVAGCWCYSAPRFWTPRFETVWGLVIFLGPAAAGLWWNPAGPVLLVSFFTLTG